MDREDRAQTIAQSLSPAQLEVMHAWWRAANYLSVGQIYLLANPLLERPPSSFPGGIPSHAAFETPGSVVRNDLDRSISSAT